MAWEEIQNPRRSGSCKVLDSSYLKLSPQKDERENQSTLNLLQQDCEKLGWKPGDLIAYLIDRDAKKIALKKATDNGYKLGCNIKQMKPGSKVKLCLSTNFQIVETLRAMWPLPINDTSINVLLKTEVIAVDGVPLLAMSFGGIQQR